MPKRVRRPPGEAPGEGGASAGSEPDEREPGADPSASGEGEPKRGAGRARREGRGEQPEPRPSESPAQRRRPRLPFGERLHVPSRERLRHPTRGMLAALAVLGAALVAAITMALMGQGDGTSSQRAATPPPPDRPIVRRSFLEQVIPPRRGSLPGAGVPGQIAAAVKAMPVHDKVAAMMLLGYDGNGPVEPVLDLLGNRPLGGIVIRRANYYSNDQITAIAGRATLAARHAHHDPPFVWAPQEGGSISALRGQPPADAPGNVGNARNAAHEAADSGRALGALNLNGVLAPVVDVGTEQGDDVLGPRAFSSSPQATARFATDVIRAYKRTGMVSVAEHFPGLGAATQSPDDGLASVGLSLDQLRKRDLVPFAAAFRAGVPAVVISNASYATDDFVTPATLSRAVSTDLLRGEMRFQGVAIADDLSQPAITTSMSVAQAAVQAIAAGSDMVYISGPARGQEAAYRALVRAVRTGKISRARLDEAVTRILTLKREYGMVMGTKPRTKVPAVVAAAPPAAGTTGVPSVPGATPGVPTPGAPGATTPVPPSTPAPGAPTP
ncbi:MAG: beta-N-acetylhexosaminidase [Thermoleophilaceae bacterium]|nr:beta-N-acetylhexosaminidase [Thermoleophilaceae bacterium]